MSEQAQIAPIDLLVDLIENQSLFISSLLTERARLLSRVAELESMDHCADRRKETAYHVRTDGR